MLKARLCLLLCLMVGTAWGQWDQVTVISPDSLYDAWPQFVVDDSFRLHVFCARRYQGGLFPRYALFYLKLDNWGNLLSGPTNFWPDSNYTDYTPGVLLDRSGIIHVLWSRNFEWPTGDRVMYARINPDGEFLTEPTVIDSTAPGQQTGMNMIQAPNGDIWGVGFDCMVAFHENGELSIPFQKIFPEESGAEGWYPIPQAAPNGHIYATIRYFSPEDTELVAVTRLDTSVRTITVISPPTGDPFQSLGAGNFFIDSTGIWHTTIGRGDHPWWFYQRMTPGGTILDTLNLALVPAGGGPFWELVGGDTLVQIWTGGPPPFRYRSGIHLDGTHEFEPIPMPLPEGAFFMPDLAHYVWKEGSYWIGGMVLRPDDAHSIAMIHVPGPNEPPNALSPNRGTATSSSLAVYPNPFGNSLQIEIGDPRARAVVIYDVLGRTVISSEFPQGTTRWTVSNPELNHLPSGAYYLTVQGVGRVQPIRMMHVK